VERVAATDPNLKEFFAHSGKLIPYHGWSDQMIAPENTINYYNSVSHTGGVESQRSIRFSWHPEWGTASGAMARTPSTGSQPCMIGWSKIKHQK